MLSLDESKFVHAIALDESKFVHAIALDESKFVHAIDEIDYSKYVNISNIDLRLFLVTRSVGSKKLSSNSSLFSVMISIITAKIGIRMILDDNVGTIFPLHKNIKMECKICKKNKASYENVKKSSFFSTSKTVLCHECLDVCIKQSNEWLYQMAKPKLLELYFLFKQTDICNHLIHDVTCIIFKLSVK
jgi:hypothetical protein